MPGLKLVEIRRVSTEEQAADDRSGLDRQAMTNAATAQRLGATIVETITLTDVCRENFVDTPEWTRIRTLIADAETHIVVDMQDRIAGSLEGIVILIECKRTGTTIYTRDGLLDLSTLQGQVLGTLTAVFSGNELGTIRHRVQGAKESRRKEGIFPSASVSLPLGIDYVRTKGQRKGRWTYTDKITVVREVFRLVIEEGLRNWSEVARKAGLNNNATIRKVLKQPLYKGWWVIDEKRRPGPTPIKADGRRKDRPRMKREPHEVIRHQVFRAKGVPPEPGDEREEAIVDEANWDAAQDIVTDKTDEYYRPRRRDEGARFIYTGVLWCADCGKRIWGRTKPKQGRALVRRDWYACASTQAAKSTCTTKYVPRLRLENAIDQLFGKIFADEQFLQNLIQVGLASESENFSEKISENDRELRRLEGRRAKLLDLYLDDDGIPKSELDVRRQKLDSDIDRTRRELERLRRAQQVSDKSTILEGLRETLTTLLEFEFWCKRQKHEFIREFFPRIEMSKLGIERVYLQVPSSRTTSVHSVATERDLPIVLSIGMTWAELQPSVPLTDFGLPVQGLYTRKDLCKLLNLTDHQFVDRLKTGVIPEASNKFRGHRAWTADEVQSIQSGWQEATPPGRWGLPQKEFHTTGDLARILGLGFERIRYLIITGAITDCNTRDSQGRRRWTETEIERAIEEVGAGERLA